MLIYTYILYKPSHVRASAAAAAVAVAAFLSGEKKTKIEKGIKIF